MTKSISTLSDIDRIRDYLSDKPRDLLLFNLATQTGCKMQQALKLKVRDLLFCNEGDSFGNNLTTIEGGDKIIATSRLLKSFQRYYKETNPNDDEFILKSRKGDDTLTPTSVSRMIHSWYKDNGIKGLSGYSSLLKTWEKFFKDDLILSAASDLNCYFDNALKPVLTKTHQETVYCNLRDAILNGTIRPGTRLKKDLLSKLFKVSDTPVREALARLLAVGLITRLDHKGYVVNQLTPEELEEIVSIRVTLECMAAKEACIKMSDVEIERLIQLHAPENHVIKDPTEFYRLNRIFHKAIYKSAGLPILLDLIENFWDKMNPYFSLLANEIMEEHPNLSWLNHQRIIDGLKRRDQEFVCQAIKDDITDYAYQIILKLKESSLLPNANMAT